MRTWSPVAMTRNTTSPFSSPVSRRTLLAGTVAMTVAAASCASAGGMTLPVDDAEDGTRDSSASSTTTTTDHSGVALWDHAVVHDLSLEFDQTEYDAAIQAYVDSEDKVWIEATVTIDGATYQQAGIRLKGNSSLFGLRNQAGGGQAGGGPGGGPGGSADSSAPETLPWLVRLDKYVDGQAHQGVHDLVIRSNNTTTAINEAVALELLGMAGLATQQAVHARLTANDRGPVLRLVIEHLDDEWDAANFADAGVLFKAESGGDWSYRGVEHAAYDDVFDQETRADEDLLDPLLGFLDFLNNSTDSQFEGDLPNQLEVDAFATYLAFEALVDNFDDIDGPGNNSYLRWSEVTNRMTVVAWDHNLAFGGVTGGGGMPGGGGPAGGGPSGGGPTGGGPGGGGRPGSTANPLTTRWAEVPDFTAMAQAASARLQADLYGSGAGQQIVDRIAALLTAQVADLVDAATVASDASGVIAYF